MTGVHNDTTVTATEAVNDDDGTIEVCKLETPNGNRAEIGEDETIRLDALALESLTWQPAAFFETLAEDGDRITERAIEAGSGTEGSSDREIVNASDVPTDGFQIGNEYTTVLLRSVSTDGTGRLEIYSPKMGYSTWLVAAELRGLARADSSLFSELLRTPLGPEAHDH